MSTKSIQKKSSLRNKKSKFIIMGLTSFSLSVGISALALETYNLYQQGKYEAKAARLFNEVWLSVKPMCTDNFSNCELVEDKEALKQYQTWINKPPLLYNFNLSQGTQTSAATLPTQLPNSAQAQERALTLYKKTSLRH